MGADFVIHYGCAPKQALTLAGLVGRLKGRDRAAAIIQLYRDEGDERAPANMGFEMVRRLPDGSEEKEVIVVQDLLDAADELTTWESHCTGCPANRAGSPFGCMGTINYPISVFAERWLLDQLPDSDAPLPYIWLQRAVSDMQHARESAAPLRTPPGVFFESPDALGRDLGALRVTGDTVFEMLFLSGPIQPAYGSMLLQFFGGISRDLDADVIMQLAAPPSGEWIDAHAPFLLRPDAADNETIRTLKEFFKALYMAFRLQVPVLLDV
ncbi:MAG: hypothetical protein JXQ72_07545 [Anaerolineae bacterium]|nr:hypothetical protein [Anaerolineae bacterium]